MRPLKSRGFPGHELLPDFCSRLTNFVPRGPQKLSLTRQLINGRVNGTRRQFAERARTKSQTGPELNRAKLIKRGSEAPSLVS